MCSITDNLPATVAQLRQHLFEAGQPSDDLDRRLIDLQRDGTIHAISTTRHKWNSPFIYVIGPRK